MTPDIRRAGIKDVIFRARVVVTEPCNLYGCRLGDDVFVGQFVEIQKRAVIGARYRVQSHAFVCELVTIGEDCLIGHGVMFINDRFSNGDPAKGDQSLWKPATRSRLVLTPPSCRLAFARAPSSEPGRLSHPTLSSRASMPATRLENPERRMIKFLDLHAQYLSIKGEIDAAIASVIGGAAFVGGSFVPAFEQDFAQWMRAPYCIGVGNGTDALEIGIEALGLPPGSEIIVPGNSFIATSEAVRRCGNRVVFAAPPASPKSVRHYFRLGRPRTNPRQEGSRWQGLVPRRLPCRPNHRSN